MLRLSFSGPLDLVSIYKLLAFEALVISCVHPGSTNYNIQDLRPQKPKEKTPHLPRKHKPQHITATGAANIKSGRVKPEKSCNYGIKGNYQRVRLRGPGSVTWLSLVKKGPVLWKERTWRAGRQHGHMKGAEVLKWRPRSNGTWPDEWHSGNGPTPTSGTVPTCAWTFTPTIVRIIRDIVSLELWAFFEYLWFHCLVP